ncbi:hypothetical protein ACEQUB_03435 [Ralstonia syzygii]
MLHRTQRLAMPPIATASTVQYCRDIAPSAGRAMSVLVTILKIAVVVVLASSLAEALVLLCLRGWRSYDWKAAGVSVVDFLMREYPLRWLLPLAFWTHPMDWVYQHRLWTLPMDRWSGWLACFIGQESATTGTTAPRTACAGSGAPTPSTTRPTSATCRPRTASAGQAG